MFQDEARFGRISDTRYCWCRGPSRPLVQAMVTQHDTYAYGAVSPQDGAWCYGTSSLNACKSSLTRSPADTQMTTSSWSSMVPAGTTARTYTDLTIYD